MRNIKKAVILFLISLVLVLGLSFGVSAAVTKGSFITYYNLTNVTVSLADVNASFAGIYQGKQYLRNDTYTFNITISNRMPTTTNITKINITLPKEMTLVGNGSLSINKTGVTFNRSIANGQLSFVWNHTGQKNTSGPLINRSGSKGSAVKLGFKAKVNYTTQKSINISIKIYYNSTIRTSTKWLRKNITLDGAAPRSYTARTVNATAMNITFSELMNMTAVSRGNFNTTVTTGGKTINITIRYLYPNTSASVTTRGQLNKSILTNETPIIKLWRGKTDNLTDLAGNPFTATSAVTSTDSAPPTISKQGLMYSYYNKTLTLVFNETINRTTLNCDNIYIGPAPNRKLRLSDVYCSSNSTSPQTNKGNTLKIVLSNAARDILSGYRNYLNVTVNTSRPGQNSWAIRDMAGNNLTNVTRQLNFVANDTTKPNITSIVYIYTNRTLRITFNETVLCNVSISNTQNRNITLANTSNITGYAGLKGFFKLTDAAERWNNKNGTICNITITHGYRDKVENWSKTALYIAWNGSAFKDLRGNNASGRSNRSGRVLTTYTYDTTAPGIYYKAAFKSQAVQGVWMNMSGTFSNRTGRHIYNITVLFNETMDQQANATISAIVGTTALPVKKFTTTGKGWINATAFSFTLNLTNLRDVNGVGTIYIRARDVRGTNSANTTARKFTVDTTPPRILKAAYEDYNLSTSRLSTGRLNNFSNDILWIDFSENVTVIKRDTMAVTNNTFNVSKVSGHMLTINKSQIFNVSKAVNSSRIKVVLNDTGTGTGLKINTHLVIRGVYATRKNTSLNASGITMARNQMAITDYAGNYAENSTPVDIADTMWSFTAGVSKAISTPYCVNVSLINAQLGSVNGTGCRAYTTGAWASLSGGNMLPLKAYSCNFGRKFDLYLYTRSNTSCTVTDSAASLTAGWNLVSVNYAHNSSMNPWLSSLDNGGGDASGVTYVYRDIDGANANKVVKANFVTTEADPFQGYWIWAENPPSGTTWSFAGTGFY